MIDIVEYTAWTVFVVLLAGVGLKLFVSAYVEAGVQRCPDCGSWTWGKRRKVFFLHRVSDFECRECDVKWTYDWYSTSNLSAVMTLAGARFVRQAGRRGAVIEPALEELDNARRRNDEGEEMASLKAVHDSVQLALGALDEGGHGRLRRRGEKLAVEIRLAAENLRQHQIEKSIRRKR